MVVGGDGVEGKGGGGGGCDHFGGDEEDAEGVGRDAQQGGEVHPSGGTDSSLAAAAPTLEVQHAIRHAV